MDSGAAIGVAAFAAVCQNERVLPVEGYLARILITAPARAHRRRLPEASGLRNDLCGAIYPQSAAGIGRGMASE